jgi:hypothetical protein
LAINSAQIFKTKSSRVPIAIITSHEGILVSLLILLTNNVSAYYHILIIGDFPAGVFNHRISIPKSIIFPRINWLTRLFALRLSPFEITLEVDSDTVNCVDLYGLLNDIYELRKGHVDIALMQLSKLADPFHPQNGIKYD